MKDRRRDARQMISRVAHFTSDVSPTPRPCLLTDISDGGARLYSEIDMPPKFTLTVSGDGPILKRECRVAWQLGGELGVEFIGADGRG